MNLILFISNKLIHLLQNETSADIHCMIGFPQNFVPFILPLLLPFLPVLPLSLEL